MCAAPAHPSPTDPIISDLLAGSLDRMGHDRDSTQRLQCDHKYFGELSSIEILED